MGDEAPVPCSLLEENFGTPTPLLQAHTAGYYKSPHLRMATRKEVLGIPRNELLPGGGTPGTPLPGLDIYGAKLLFLLGAVIACHSPSADTLSLRSMMTP